jgi:hypothetical protein
MRAIGFSKDRIAACDYIHVSLEFHRYLNLSLMHILDSQLKRSDMEIPNLRYAYTMQDSLKLFL